MWVVLMPPYRCAHGVCEDIEEGDQIAPSFGLSWHEPTTESALLIRSINVDGHTLLLFPSFNI